MDILPTVLDALELQPSLPTLSWSDGVSLLAEVPADRLVVVTGVGFPTGGRTLALLHVGYKLWLERDGPIHRFKVVKRLSPDDRELGPEHTPDEGRWLSRLGATMRRFLRAESAVSAVAPPVQHQVNARYGEWIRLVGYDLEVRDAKPGGAVVLRWVFECLAPVPAGYNLFVHLGPGHPTAFVNLDHVPVDGTLPLAKWRPGDFISDEQVFELPQTMPSGQPLKLTLGFWSEKDGRAKVHAEGREIGDNALVVTTIAIP